MKACLLHIYAESTIVHTAAVANICVVCMEHTHILHNFSLISVSPTSLCRCSQAYTGESHLCKKGNAINGIWKLITFSLFSKHLPVQSTRILKYLQKYFPIYCVNLFSKALLTRVARCSTEERSKCFHKLVQIYNFFGLRKQQLKKHRL